MATSQPSRHPPSTPTSRPPPSRPARPATSSFASSRKVTNAYLDGVEKYVHGVAQFQRKLGEQSKLEPFAGVLTPRPSWPRI